MAEREPPRVEEGDGAVMNRPVDSSGIAARLMPWAFMLAVAVVIGVLLYLTSPAARWLIDNDLLIWSLSGVLVAGSWWFRNVVWPDDPRDS